MTIETDSPAEPLPSAAAVTLVDDGGEVRIDSRHLAELLEIQHDNVIEILREYGEDFLQFGVLPFQTEKPIAGSRGGRPRRYVMLSEHQCYLLLTYTRNTPRTRQLKVRLIKAFETARLGNHLRLAEYLPSYHSLHDRFSVLAAQSSNQDKVHMNVNKLVNKTVGIGPGQRATLPMGTRSAVVVAQEVARQATEGCVDHHDGYQRAKARLEALRLAMSPGSLPTKAA